MLCVIQKINKGQHLPLDTCVIVIILVSGRSRGEESSKDKVKLQNSPFLR